MTESLFLMQRYYGSDDSDTESKGNDLNKLENILQQAREKRGKLENTEAIAHSALNGPSEASIAFNLEETFPLESEKPKEKDVTTLEMHSNEQNEELMLSKIKKKKKKRKRSTDTNEEEQAKKIKIEEEVVVEAVTVRQVKECGTENTEESKKHHLEPQRKLKKKAENKIIQVGQSDNSVTDVACEDTDFNKVTPVLSEKADENDAENRENLFPIIKDVMNKKHEKVTRILPEWLASPRIIKVDVRCAEKSVGELEFLDECTKLNLKKCSIQYLFPVQTEVIPWLMQSSLRSLIVRPSDVCISAPTGSGKTLAFVIPIIQSLKNRIVCAIRAITVLPVGDLAVQVFKVFELFCKGTELRVALVIGQKSFMQEQSSLVKKTSTGYLNLADIIVCTPGRLIDHIDRTPGFTVQQLRFLVIDEADRMMEEIQQGWLKKVESAIYVNKITSNCLCFSEKFKYDKVSPGPATACAFGHVSEPLQKVLCSATLSQDPEKLHEMSLYRPKLFTTVLEKSNKTSDINISEHFSGDEFIGKYITPRSLMEYFIVCEPTIKPLIIHYIIKERQFKKVLCFTQSVEHTHRLFLVLNDMMDSKVRELSSNLRGVQRKIVLEQFTNGKIGVLVCSDLIARGMDIDGVDCVISYDMPTFIKKYIHRIGRTARAGKDGVAITLLEQKQISRFKKMLVSSGKSPPSKLKIENSDLAPFEDAFKKALSTASQVIANEKHDFFVTKRTFSSMSPAKGRSPNNKNHYSKAHQPKKKKTE